MCHAVSLDWWWKLRFVTVDYQRQVYAAHCEKQDQVVVLLQALIEIMQLTYNFKTFITHPFDAAACLNAHCDDIVQM